MRILISHLIPCYFLIVMLHSCSDKQDKKNIIYQSFDSELKNMQHVMRNSTEELLADLDNNRSEPSRYLKAEIWYPKAVKIRKFTDSTISYIKGLKKTLPSEDNNVLADISQIKLHELYDQLVTYKNNVLNVDDLLRNEFENNLVIFSSNQNDIQITEEEFTSFFEVILIHEALLLLRHLENNIRYIENRTITFCLEQVGSTDGPGMFDQFSTIIGQSSSVIKKGEAVEITAGVGSFSKAAAPTITIDGMSVQLSEDGVARYKLSPNTTLGKKTVKIRIEFTDQEGMKRLVERSLEYLVVE